MPATPQHQPDVTISFRKEDAVTTVRSSLVDVRVMAMDKEATTGSARATLELRGSRHALERIWRVWLRYGVTIRHRRHYECWAGFIETMTLSLPHIGRAWVHDLSDMRNRVAVAYTDARGQQHTTSWAEDTASVTRYSARELLIQGTTVTQQAAAEQLRDSKLALKSMPIVRVDTIDQDSEGEMVLTLECVGWQHLGTNILYLQTAGDEGHVLEQGTGWSALAWGHDPPATPHITSCSQRFALDDSLSFQALEVEVMIARRSIPPDLLIELMSDSGGAPNAVLATATITDPEGEISEFTNFSWVTGTFDLNPELSPGTAYWLRLRATGSAVDPVIQYYWAIDRFLRYSRGYSVRFHNNSLRYLIAGNGAAPSAPLATRAATEQSGDNGDFLFRVIGGWTTKKRLEQAVAVVSALTINTAQLAGSGAATALSHPEETGERSVLEVLEALLEEGTDDGRRLLMAVSASRIVTIRPEPLPADYKYRMRGRQLYSRGGQKLSWAVLPVGEWIFAEDGPPPALTGSSTTRDPRYLLLESAGYDAEADDLTSPQWRGQRDVYDLAEE